MNTCFFCLLSAIATVENGPENNIFQFIEPTWKQHTNIPFRTANRNEQWEVAFNHLDWLIERKKSGDPFVLAVAWNAGVNAKLRIRHLDYAERVVNIYNEKRQSIPHTPCHQ